MGGRLLGFGSLVGLFTGSALAQSHGLRAAGKGGWRLLPTFLKPLRTHLGGHAVCRLGCAQNERGAAAASLRRGVPPPLQAAATSPRPTRPLIDASAASDSAPLLPRVRQGGRSFATAPQEDGAVVHARVARARLAAAGMPS